LSITETLGKPLSARDLAPLLGLSYQTVIAKYEEYGGIRISPKRIIFYEKDVANALASKRRSLDRPGETGGAEDTKDIPVEVRGDSVGIGPEKKAGRRMVSKFGTYPWESSR